MLFHFVGMWNTNVVPQVRMVSKSIRREGSWSPPFHAFCSILPHLLQVTSHTSFCLILPLLCFAQVLRYLFLPCFLIKESSLHSTSLCRALLCPLYGCFILYCVDNTITYSTNLVHLSMLLLIVFFHKWCK